MNKKEKGLVIDWLNEIIDNPEEWKRFYSNSEVKLLAEKAKELIFKADDNNNETESYYPRKEYDAQSGWTLFYCGKCNNGFWRSDANFCEVCGAKVKR